MQIDSAPDAARAVAVAAAFAASITLAPCAWAQQSENDIETLKKMAGTYSAYCKKADALRLVVSPQSLAIVAGKKRVQAPSPMAAVSYLGGNPPKDFEAALLAENDKGPSLLFTAWSGKGGNFLKVEADKRLEEEFGKGALAGKFTRCR